FYKGTIPTPENLPRGFHLVGQDDINRLTAAGLWRRESIQIAAEHAIRVAGQPVVPGSLVGYTHIDNSVNPQAATQAQRITWNVLEQMKAAQNLADLTRDTMPQLR
ncbi:hypothetical protein HYS00_02315, partial [Candidatus Microgenomates bacterium]|nr:hypothetical protein [Candidatus Microgenomates bacterium]